MEHKEQHRVLTLVKEELNTVQLERAHVVQYQVDITLQVVTVQETNVQDNHNALNQLVRLLEHIVQMV